MKEIKSVDEVVREQKDCLEKAKQQYCFHCKKPIEKPEYKAKGVPFCSYSCLVYYWRFD